MTNKRRKEDNRHSDESEKSQRNTNQIYGKILTMLIPISILVAFIYLRFFQYASSSFTVPTAFPIFKALTPKSPKVVKFGHSKAHDSRSTDPHIRSLCSKSEKLFEALADSKHSFYDTSNHAIGHTVFSKNAYSRQAYVANGYIGARISTLGQGFSYDEINTHTNIINEEVLQNGWPLFNKRYTGAFVAGFFSLQEKLPETNFPELYSNGYDSIISSIPYWPTLDLLLNKNGVEYRFNPMTTTEDHISNYHQNLSLANGIVSTKLTWLEEIEIVIDVYVHRTGNWLGVMDLKMKPLNKDLDVVVQSFLNFTTSQRTELVDVGFNEKPGIHMVVSPENVPYSSAAIVSQLDLSNTTKFMIGNDTVVEEAKVHLSKGEETEIHKYTGISSSERTNSNSGEGKTQKDEARSQLEFVRTNLERILETSSDDHLKNWHKEEWEKYFNHSDIYFPSDGLLTLTARASLFHILANTDINAHNLTSALSAAGLSSDSYGGMVFWDTDLWIVPGLIPFFPKVAKAVADYRVYTHQQAKLNAEQYGYKGAAYPWVSGRFGNCTSAGPCLDYEYHVNVDIALSSWLLYSTGESEEYLKDVTWPLLKDAADFLSQYTQFDEDSGKFVTRNLTDPDEYANHVDNGAFTNSGIDAVLKVALLVAYHLGEEINPRWVEVVNKIYIPISKNGITLEYSEMNASVSIKQADVVLLTFPLDNVVDVERSRNDLFYYSLKQADIGPAMAFPIFTVASSRLLDYGCSSQSYLRKSVIPYIRSPFAQFSEQADDNILTNGGTHPAFPFLTAHGGYLQAIVHGMLGLKFSVRVSSNTHKIERYLRFDPVKLHALPGGVVVKGIDYMGQRIDVILTDNEGVIRNHGEKPIQVEVQSRNAKSGNYTVKPKTEFIVPAFEPHPNIKGSYTECSSIANLTAGAPGEVALSAIDGNNYTYWQPLRKDQPGKLLIDLGGMREVRKGLIIWGSRPARFFSLSVFIHTGEKYEEHFEDVLLSYDESKFEKVIDSWPVDISEPYNPKYAKEVKLLPNNETVFEVHRDGVYARYLVVEINDTIDDDDELEGGTLNEFAIF